MVEQPFYFSDRRERCCFIVTSSHAVAMLAGRTLQPHLTRAARSRGPRDRLDARLPALGMALGFEMRCYREVKGPHQAPWPPGSCH